MTPWRVLTIFTFTLVVCANVAAENDLSILDEIKSTAALQQWLQQLYESRGTQHAERASDTDYLDKLSIPCRNHTEWYEKNKMTNNAAMYMYDSSTKLPEGILYGDLVHLGNFDECISVRDVETGDGIFHGQHCLASISLKSTPTRAMALFMLALRALKIAQCVPSSCSTEDVEVIASNAMKSMMTAMPEMESLIEVKVDELECHTADKPEYQPEDYVAIVVLVAFGVLVVGSTCYDLVTRSKESRSNILMAFSVYTNGKKLLATSKGGDTLHCVHGIRFISMAWVVLGHTYMHSLSFAPVSNLLPFATDAPENWKYMHITNGVLSVDTFFVLSGLLVAYVFFRTVRKTNSFNVPMYYIHRYIRLTPAYAMTIFLVTTLWMYTGSGPLFDARAITEKENCVSNWWINLLYLQNYVDSLTMCVSQTWYLAVDMQLYWLSPLVLIPLWKWPKIGYVLMGLLTLAGLVTNYIISDHFNFYGGYFMNVRSQLNSDYMKYFYYPVHTRFVPYLIGIALGYLLVQIKDKKITVRIPKLFILGLWMLAAFLMLFTFYIVLPFQQTDYVNNVVEGAFYNALGRPGWGLGVSIVIFLCASGYGGFVNSLLSWDWFQVLGRLTYSIYLVHMNVQITRMGSERGSLYIDDMVMIPRFISDFMISLFIAVPMALVLESPFIILEKELLGGKKKSTPRPAEIPAATFQNGKLEEVPEVQGNGVAEGHTNQRSEHHPA